MALNTLRLLVRALKTNGRSLHTSQTVCFLELKKSQYPTKYDGVGELKNKSVLNQLRDGCKVLKSETQKYFEERKLNQLYHTHIPIPDETSVIWQFNSDPKTLNQWVVTSDSDYGEGDSTAKLELSPAGTGIFSGTLNTTPRKDGKTKYTGYCNMTTVPKYKSFFRKDYYNFRSYTHLVMRVRGDGRVYAIILRQKQHHDLTWNDAYQYFAYTTGGPLWQIIKIPFSKFVFCSKGTIQRYQFYQKPWASHFGITMADNVTGDFRLEIDYIGVEQVSHHFEENTYETYTCGDIMEA